MAPRKSKTPTPPEQKPQKEFSPFDFVNSINYDKNDLVRNSDDPPSVEKLYNPWLINRALSYHVATLFDANMINSVPHLPNQLQYDCLRVMVRREKRFSKWFKPELQEEIKLLQDVFNVNVQRAQEMRRLLTNDQMKAIKDSRYTGGC